MLSNQIGINTIKPLMKALKLKLIKLVFLYWPSICVSTQSCDGIRSTFFATWKLSSPTRYMLSLIWKCGILHLMNARYGITNMQILIKSKEQLNSFLGKNHLEIFALMKWSIYSTKLSKIFSQITFPMKQLLVMIETHLGLTARLSS